MSFSEAIENPLVNEVIYDVVCGKLYQAIVFPHSAVNLETLLVSGYGRASSTSFQAISKMEATGKLPVDFAIRVFIQMLEGCAFLNKVSLSIIFISVISHDISSFHCSPLSFFRFFSHRKTVGICVMLDLA